MNKKMDNKGTALALVVALVFLISMIGIALLVSSFNSTKQSVFSMEFEQDYYNAESMLHIAARQLNARIMTEMVSSSSVDVISASFPPETPKNIIEEAIIEGLIETQDEIKKIIYAAYNAMPPPALPFAADDVTLQSWTTLGWNSAPIVFIYDDPTRTAPLFVLNDDKSEIREYDFGNPRVTISAVSGNRTVSIDVDLQVNPAAGFVLTVTGGQEGGIEVIRRLFEQNNGVAYFEDWDGTPPSWPIYGGITAFARQQYYDMWPCTMFTDTVYDPVKVCECEPEACDPPRIFRNTKEAEYEMLLEALDKMFTNAPTAPPAGNFFSGIQPTGSAIQYRVAGDTAWLTPTPANAFSNAANIRAWFAANPNAEDLYVPGNLTLSGANTTSLKSIYVGGTLTIDNGSSFSGHSEITNFLIMGRGASGNLHQGRSYDFGLRVNGGGTTTISNAQFNVKENILVWTGNSGGGLLGNGIYTSFENKVVIEGQNNPSFTIGNSLVAPQFYARDGFVLHANDVGCTYHGIFGTTSKDPTLFTGSSNPDYTFAGLLIGRFARPATLGAYNGEMIESDFSDWLTLVMQGRVEEEEIETESIPVRITGTLLNDENALSIDSFLNLHEVGS